MTMFARRLPLLLGMLAGAACGGNDEPGGNFDDDAGTAIDARRDDATVPTDGTTTAEASDGASVIDANRDAGGSRGDTGNPDGGARGDASRDVNDASSGSDTNRTDSAGTNDATSSDTRRDVIDAQTTPDATSDVTTPSCVGMVDTEFLREKLSKLTGVLPVQIDGMDVMIPERNSAANRARARQFLRAEYEALGFTVTEHTYATGVNLVASRAGADSKYLIVSAHYDSIRDTVAGADDDGSGTIAGLATAKALQNCQLDHGLRIVAFDEEEDGLVGSKAYVSSLQSSGDLTSLIGDLQLEMLGYHTKQDGGFLLVDCRSSEGDRPESKFLNDAVLAAIARGNIALEPHDSCTGSSDHSPFWTASKPAIVFSQEFFFSGADSTPCYHKDCDKLDQINFDYYSKLTTLAVSVTADQVGAH
ncbi:MAG: M28 family peptidase [Polyangiaceae bacterium]